MPYQLIQLTIGLCLLVESCLLEIGYGFLRILGLIRSRLFSDEEWQILEKEPVPTGQNH